MSGRAGDRPPRVRAETLYGLLFVALMGGMIASLYAAYESANPAAAGYCTVNSYVSCAKVQQSSHNTTLTVPDWVIGVGGYLAMIVVAALANRTYERRYLRALQLLSLAGVGFTLFFVYNELVVIQAICIVCTAAHLLNLLVLVAATALLRLGRGGDQPEVEGPAPPP